MQFLSYVQSDIQIPDRINKSEAKFFHIVLGILLMAACAQVSIPLKPVPITLHTLGILLISFFYTPKEAAIIVFFYVLTGIGGLPVFSGYGSGAERILGPSGGYIVGFCISAPIGSYYRRTYLKQSSMIVNYLIISILCQAIVYSAGLWHLSKFISFDKALYCGFIIFIPTGIIKMIILSSMLGIIHEKNI
ncbi:MAG: hypothetical protein EB127_07750 [Alphaproteobacteria bacterium]|nr:hypothetical protein [Alphaproteobacteria bacterium]